MLNFLKERCCNMWSGRFFAAVQAVLCLLQLTASAGSTTRGQEIFIQVVHVESTISSIAMNWTSNFTLSNFQVRARSLVSGITLSGHVINDTKYTMTDLMIDTSYEICVTADVRSSDSALPIGVNEDHAKKFAYGCLQASTIPIVRLDSVLVLLGVIAFVLLSITIALCCWKRANRANPATESKDNSDGLEADDPHVVGVLNKTPDDAARPLLATNDRPTDKANNSSLTKVENVSEAEPSSDLKSNEHHSEAVDQSLKA